MMEMMVVVMMMEMIIIRFVHYCGGKFMQEHVFYHKGAYTLCITQIAVGLPWCIKPAHLVGLQCGSPIKPVHVGLA